MALRIFPSCVLTDTRFQLVGVARVVGPVSAFEDVDVEGHRIEMRRCCNALRQAQGERSLGHSSIRLLAIALRQAQGERSLGHWDSRLTSVRSEPFDSLRAGLSKTAYAKSHIAGLSQSPFDKLRANGV